MLKKNEITKYSKKINLQIWDPEHELQTSTKLKKPPQTFRNVYEPLQTSENIYKGLKTSKKVYKVYKLSINV